MEKSAGMVVMVLVMVTDDCILTKFVISEGSVVSMQLVCS